MSRRQFGHAEGTAQAIYLKRGDGVIRRVTIWATRDMRIGPTRQGIFVTDLPRHDHGRSERPTRPELMGEEESVRAHDLFPAVVAVASVGG